MASSDKNKADGTSKLFARFFIISAIVHGILFFIFLRSPFQAAERVKLPPSINVSITTITKPKKEKNSIVKKQKVEQKSAPKPVIKKPVRKKVVKKAAEKKDSVNLKKKKIKKKVKKPVKKKTEKEKAVKETSSKNKNKKKDNIKGSDKKTVKQDNQSKLEEVYKRLREKVKEESIIRETEISNKAKALGKIRAKRIREYQNHIAMIVEKNWSYNKQISKKTDSLETLIVFKVMPDGSIKDIVFEKESDDSYLNESAYKAIIKSNPLSPHPKDINESYILIPLKFTPSGIR